MLPPEKLCGVEYSSLCCGHTILKRVKRFLCVCVCLCVEIVVFRVGAHEKKFDTHFFTQANASLLFLVCVYVLRAVDDETSSVRATINLKS